MNYEKNPILIVKKDIKYKSKNWNIYYFIKPTCILFISDQHQNESIKIYSHHSCIMCEFMRCYHLSCLKKLDDEFTKSDIIIFYSELINTYQDNLFQKYLINKQIISITLNTQINKENNFECSQSILEYLNNEDKNNINLLSKCRRFLILSPFKINLKPIRKRILLTPKEYSNIPQIVKPLIYYEQELSGNKLCYINRKIVRNSTEDIKEQIYEYLKSFSYDFTVYPYYDIVSDKITFVLKYKRNNKTPFIRIHSIRHTDSIIPLRSWSNYSKWKRSIDLIIKNGHGYIILTHGDGKGYGLPAYFLNENKSMSRIGMQSDGRDFEGAIALLNDICFEKNISVLYSKDKEKLIPIYEKYHFKIQKWYKSS